MVRLRPVWMTNHPPSVLWYCWLGLLTCKNRRPYNLYCVGADVKPCSINLYTPLVLLVNFELFQTWYRRYLWAESAVKTIKCYKALTIHPSILLAATHGSVILSLCEICVFTCRSSDAILLFLVFKCQAVCHSLIIPSDLNCTEVCLYRYVIVLIIIKLCTSAELNNIKNRTIMNALLSICCQ